MTPMTILNGPVLSLILTVTLIPLNPEPYSLNPKR